MLFKIPTNENINGDGKPNLRLIAEVWIPFFNHFLVFCSKIIYIIRVKEYSISNKCNVNVENVA